MSKKSNLEILLWLIKIRGLISSRSKNLQKRIGVFLAFLLIATIGWLLRSLQELYTADIRYPIKYINLPQGKTLVDAPAKHLFLSIRTDGYTILKNKIKFKLPIKFDINAFSSVATEIDSNTFFILTRFAKEKLENDLSKKNNAIEIINIEPDTITFNLTELIRKKVPVEVTLSQLENSILKQFKLNGRITTEPDSVMISGPKYYTDSIHKVQIIEPDLPDIFDTTIIEAKLKQNKGVKLHSNKIFITIPVDRSTEKLFTNLKFEMKNVPDSITLKTFPSEIDISLVLTLSYYDSITQSDLRPFIDYYDILSDETSALKINIDSFPYFVSSHQIKPRYVEILRERKTP